LHRHAIAQQAVDGLIVAVQIAAMIRRLRTEPVQRRRNLLPRVTGFGQMSNRERFFDVGIVGSVGPVAEVAISEFFMEQPDDAILRNPFGFSDIAHINRILPVNNSCIMPCLIWRALSSFFSRAATSASISERTAAIANCSAADGGIGMTR